MKTLIVIPAFNEEESLPATLDSLQYLTSDYEIIVVNDGSRDATAAVANKAAESSKVPIHVVSLPRNRGIGAAVQTGYLFAATQNRFEYVIQFDADGQHDADAIPNLVKACEEKQLDVALGHVFSRVAKTTFAQHGLGDLAFDFLRDSFRIFQELRSLIQLVGFDVRDRVPGKLLLDGIPMISRTRSALLVCSQQTQNWRNPSNNV